MKSLIYPEDRVSCHDIISKIINKKIPFENSSLSTFKICRNLQRIFSQNKFAEFEYPVLFLQGEYDIISSMKNIEFLKSRLEFKNI